MSKLYIFGIGGTGSRVLKSLVNLLGSGVKCNDTIVPIVIDADSANQDLTRTMDLLNRYNRVHEQLTFGDNAQNDFFRTEIQQLSTGYTLNLVDSRQANFAQYMSLGTMSNENQALMNLLFSKDNLDSTLTEGFMGNPNIGSIVLNQFAASKEFQAFANGFQQGDKIFIIASIFGGTGASGLPLLLKTLRTNNNMSNAGWINNAPIGGVVVLPYFSVQVDKNSKIDSATFITKAKSAMAYYMANITGNDSIDSIYYVGDNVHNVYENHEGGSEQRNDAHLIELIAALAALDFSETGVHSSDNPALNKTVQKEFGVDSISDDMLFSNFNVKTLGKLKNPMIQFLLFHLYLKNTYRKEWKYQPWAREGFFKKEKKLFNDKFTDTEFFRDVNAFHIAFFEWLSEMDGNKRSFAPFNLESKSLSKLVKDESAKNVSPAVMDSYLNKQSVKNMNPQDHFMELFYRATKQLVEDKF